ncbi:MAG: HAMP domain-containing histidine kinase [Clostridia bacterium]|nr:HAMP domain-containing histidine kinase [Clostridia bacterium]
MQGSMYITEQAQLAALAHDLRTPICCVEGAVQRALCAERQGKDVSTQLRQILEAVRAMDGMLVSAADDTRRQTITAVGLQRELEAICAPRAVEKGQRFSVDVSALGEGDFSQDYGSLTRVLVNLISNAIKYTPAGGEITLRAQVLTLPWRRDASWLRFVVADNGMGMKGAFLRRMYLPYARAKGSAHLPGKGLGLAIVKRLVRQMGGAIHVKSEWGKGTVFTVTVPAARC